MMKRKKIGDRPEFSLLGPVLSICFRVGKLGLPPVFLAVLCLLASGCAMNEQERAANQSRTNAWRSVNDERAFKQTEITGIEVISGRDMKITTWGELNQVQAPDIQYDTSDTDMARSFLDAAGKVAAGALVVWGMDVAGDALRPSDPVVVTQPAPVVVRPEVVHPTVVIP